MSVEKDRAELAALNREADKVAKKRAYKLHPRLAARDAERFAKLADEPRPELPEGYSGQLTGRSLDGMIADQIAKTQDQLARLRELRLWHWNKVLFYRWQAKTVRRERDDISIRQDKTISASFIATGNDEQAAKHLAFVQTLNDFFPADDTAERDAAKVAT